MRRLILLISLLLLSTAWVFAQSNSTENNATGDNSQATSGSDYNQGAMSSPEGSSQSQGGMTTSATGNERSATSTGERQTIVGCLSENNGQFTLTDQSGNAYQLTGKSSGLKAHVGHEIRVTGRMSTSGRPGSMSGEQANTMPTISVTSFKHISSSCKASSSMH